jgi:hypothetical protein
VDKDRCFLEILLERGGASGERFETRRKKRMRCFDGGWRWVGVVAGLLVEQSWPEARVGGRILRVLLDSVQEWLYFVA